jgi:hypothetical protein
MNGLRGMLVIAFVFILGVPPAPEHVTLEYSLTFSGTSAGGMIVGTWGGTDVQGTFSDGRLGNRLGGAVGGQRHLSVHYRLRLRRHGGLQGDVHGGVAGGKNAGRHGAN